MLFSTLIGVFSEITNLSITTTGIIVEDGTSGTLDCVDIITDVNATMTNCEGWTQPSVLKRKICYYNSQGCKMICQQRGFNDCISITTKTVDNLILIKVTYDSNGFVGWISSTNCPTAYAILDGI